MEHVSLASLWLPILLSAVIVFVAAFVAWTVLPHHRSDWVQVPNEDALLQALRELRLERGQYMFPQQTTPEGAKVEGAREKLEKGPRGSLIIWDMPKMGKNLAFYFLFCLGVSFMVAYVGYAARIPAGEDYLHVFRVLGTVAFLAYSAAEACEALDQEVPDIVVIEPQAWRDDSPLE